MEEHPWGETCRCGMDVRCERSQQPFGTKSEDGGKGPRREVISESTTEGPPSWQDGAVPLGMSSKGSVKVSAHLNRRIFFHIVSALSFQPTLVSHSGHSVLPR